MWREDWNGLNIGRSKTRTQRFDFDSIQLLRYNLSGNAGLVIITGNPEETKTDTGSTVTFVVTIPEPST
jgi:hypothetical protein